MQWNHLVRVRKMPSFVTNSHSLSSETEGVWLLAFSFQKNWFLQLSYFGPMNRFSAPLHWFSKCVERYFEDERCSSHQVLWRWRALSKMLLQNLPYVLGWTLAHICFILKPLSEPSRPMWKHLPSLCFLNLLRIFTYPFNLQQSFLEQHLLNLTSQYLTFTTEWC